MSNAVVDISTGRIIGCKKFSPVWWHEKGHSEFNKCEKGLRYCYYHDLFFMIGFLILSFSMILKNFVGSVIFFEFFAFGFACLVFYLYVYEEIWCWMYSWDNRRKWVRKNEKNR